MKHERNRILKRKHKTNKIQKHETNNQKTTTIMNRTEQHEQKFGPPKNGEACFQNTPKK